MMSWFGGGGGKKPEENKVPDFTEASEDMKNDFSMGNFDPSVFERAAKAARYLESSKGIREAFEVMKVQEVTKQKEHEANRAMYMENQLQLAIRKTEAEAEAAARTLKNQLHHEKERAEYMDKLERERMKDQLIMQRQIKEEERKKIEESLARQEEMKRRTLEYETELRQKADIAKIMAEANGRIQQERENHDLIIEKNKLQLLEYRQTMLESIKVAGTTLGEGWKTFISDKSQLVNTVALATALTFGFFSVKYSSQVIKKYAEAVIGKPTLVRETSRINLLQSPLSMFRNMTSKQTLTGSALSGIVLDSHLESRLNRIGKSTANTKRNKAPYRHLLLYGPPGTGKTMFAKNLARESGMHYAIMTGGDIAPLGRDAVTEIHKLFEWANKSNKGVLIFIDEADAFLRKRETESISEDMRNALNAFLYRTGEASNKFMVVFASNEPEHFDWAINDRIDELVSFQLPNLHERVRMLKLYIDKYLVHAQTANGKSIIVSDIDDETIKTFAKETKGFSGREISKLAIAWQAAAYGSVNAEIDKEMMTDVLNEMKESKILKSKWLSKGELENITANLS